MPPWLNWLFDELHHIRQFKRLAVGLCVLALLASWGLASLLSKTQISNLKSEVALLNRQLATADNPPSLLPWYSLGGSNLLIYNYSDSSDSLKWSIQKTAEKVNLNWDNLVNVEAYAVLQMRAEGDPASTWVQGRIFNITSGEVVATTERHSGGKISVRLPLPRATGVQSYYMQLRGKNAGLEGRIELVSTTP